jgi:hypothetical protein
MNSNTTTAASNTNVPQQTHLLGDNIAKVYEDRFKDILTRLTMLSDTSSTEAFSEIQRDVESKLIEFDKVIDEECMTRIIDAYRLNLSYITKLKEYKHDFNREYNSLETIAKNTARMFEKIDLSNNNN